MPSGKQRPLQLAYRTSLARLESHGSIGSAGSRRTRSQSSAAGEARGHADPRRALGLRGEGHAASHFKAMGFQVLALKDHRRFGEIDMVVFDGRTLVFVEIKTVRISSELVGAQSYDEQTLGWPSIGQFKRQRRAVASWLAAEGSQLPRAECVRLDVVKILLDERDELARLDHIEAAWEGAW